MLIISICSGRKSSPFGSKFILSGLLRTLQSTLFGESFIFLASFRCCCFQAFGICLFGDLNGVWKHLWAIKAEPTDPLTSLCAISWWGRNPSWLLPPSVTLLAGTTGAGDKETWTSKTAQALTKEAADTKSKLLLPSRLPPRESWRIL